MKKILVVIDYQNDFVNGSLGFDGAEKLDEKIADRIYSYGKGNVFFTRDTHFDDYPTTNEGRNLPVDHCRKGSFGYEIYGKTKKALEDVNAVGFDKQTFGLDITDDILKQLPENPVSIELAGLVSNICVLSNAVTFQTKFKNAEIIVDAELTSCADSATNEKALDIMEGLFVKVLNRK